MLIRDLKIQVFGQILLSVALLGGSLVFWQKPLPDIASRPIPHWQPNTTASPLTQSFDNLGAPFNQALARPVFRAGRRPFDPAQHMMPSQPAPPPVQQIAIVPQPPPDTSQILLRGISINAGKNRVLISSPEAPDGTWLALGGVIAGWKVKAIDRNSVHLAFGDQEAILSLYVDNLSKPVGSPEIAH